MTPLEWWWWLQVMQTTAALLGILVAARVVAQSSAEREALFTSALAVQPAYLVILNERRDLAWLLVIMAVSFSLANLVNFSRPDAVTHVSWWVLVWAVNGTAVRLLVVLMAWRRLAARRWLDDALLESRRRDTVSGR